MHISLGLHEGRPRYRRSLEHLKENIQHFKIWNLFTFCRFVGLFCPPESGSNTDRYPGSISTTLIKRMYFTIESDGGNASFAGEAGGAWRVEPTPAGAWGGEGGGVEEQALLRGREEACHGGDSQAAHQSGCNQLANVPGKGLVYRGGKGLESKCPNKAGKKYTMVGYSPTAHKSD